jgi:hypothetical protein
MDGAKYKIALSRLFLSINVSNFLFKHICLHCMLFGWKCFVVYCEMISNMNEVKTEFYLHGFVMS